MSSGRGDLLSIVPPLPWPTEPVFPSPPSDGGLARWTRGLLVGILVVFRKKGGTISYAYV